MSKIDMPGCFQGRASVSGGGPQQRSMSKGMRAKRVEGQHLTSNPQLLAVEAGIIGGLEQEGESRGAGWRGQ